MEAQCVNYNFKRGFMSSNSILQCFPLVIGSLFLMQHTLNNIVYFLAFTSCITGIMVIQLVSLVYAKGICNESTRSCITYSHNSATISAFSLFVGLFLNVFMINCDNPISLMLYSVLFVFSSCGIYLCYQLL